MSFHLQIQHSQDHEALQIVISCSLSDQLFSVEGQAENPGVYPFL